MQTLNRMLVSAMAATLFLAVGAVWQQPAAQEAEQNAAACLERPTVTCAVDLALAASAASDVDDERAQLLVRTAHRLENVGARMSYLDQAATRFF